MVNYYLWIVRTLSCAHTNGQICMHLPIHIHSTQVKEHSTQAEIHNSHGCNQWSHTPGELVFNLLTSKDQKCLIQRHIQSIEVDMCRRKKKIFCGFFSSPLFPFAPLNPYIHPDCFPQSSSLLHFCFTLFLFIG